MTGYGEPEVHEPYYESVQSQSKTTFKEQELFGGAFLIKQLPDTFRDISDFVPVGDNQEIFSDTNESNPAYSGNQLIIDILEKHESETADAIAAHFKELGNSQQAKDPLVLSQKIVKSEAPAEVAEICKNISVSGSSYSIHLLKGTQQVMPNKKQQGDRDFVTLLMCLFRFEEPYTTDLLVSLHIPDKHTMEEDDKAESGQSAAYKQYVELCEGDFKEMISSFTIKEASLKELLGMD
uniref:Ran guanine nucleotide release factor n=1 Tax=Strombidium inclinatum TaxID=197538 RepID=A0A7S3ICF9_9SPIT